MPGSTGAEVRLGRSFQEVANRLEFFDRGDVLVFGGVQDHRLPVPRHLEGAVVPLFHVSQGGEERSQVVPLQVVSRRVAEDRLEGVLVMPIQVGGNLGSLWGQHGGCPGIFGGNGRNPSTGFDASDHGLVNPQARAPKLFGLGRDRPLEAL